MSSWPAALTSRLPTAFCVALFGLGCQGPNSGDRPAPAATSVAPPKVAPVSPPAPTPWFQGEWHGGAPETPPPGAPVTVQLVIDASGQVTGTTSSNLILTGLVDQDTVRIEAAGASGHGVAVLHHRTDTLKGILHYAPPGAEQGARLTLTLARGAPP
jgi:hypothetical protein